MTPLLTFLSSYLSLSNRPTEPFPPQARIVLAFVDPPDIVGAVFRLVYKVPDGFDDGTDVFVMWPKL